MLDKLSNYLREFFLYIIMIARIKLALLQNFVPKKCQI